MRERQLSLKGLLAEYNKKILSINTEELSKQLPIGILNGKMGLCIYLFHVNRLYNEKKYQKIAEQLLNDIFSNINYVDSLKELVWVGLSINYLLEEEYVEGNVNEILEDLDNLIFQKLLSSKTPPLSNLNQMEIILYLITRLKKQKKGTNDEFLFQEFIISRFNDLYIKGIKEDFYLNPVSYTIEYKVPIFLYILSEIYGLDFYNYRIERILNEIRPRLLSSLPTLHCNRLYFLWGLLRIKKQTQSEIWDNSISIIKSNLDIEKIICKELINRELYIHNGVSSIFMLINDINKMYSDFLLLDKKIFEERIEKSVLWHDLENKKLQLNEQFGFIRGLAGLSFISSQII